MRHCISRLKYIIIAILIEKYNLSFPSFRILWPTHSHYLLQKQSCNVFLKFRLMVIQSEFSNFLSQLFLILRKGGLIKFNFLTSISYISLKVSPAIHYLPLHSSRMYFLMEMDNVRNVLCCTKTWSKFRNKYEGWPWSNWTKLSRYQSLAWELLYFGCT